ncbi:hypothetical protein [Paracandidimonas soli]|nr:hypothetical protein [Paracandidimonas soli]
MTGKSSEQITSAEQAAWHAGLDEGRSQKELEIQDAWHDGITAGRKIERNNVAAQAQRPARIAAWRTVDSDGRPLTDWIDGAPAPNERSAWYGGHIELAYTAPALPSEQLIQAAIGSSPEPLRHLGAWLATVLDEHQWAKAERMLLEAVRAAAKEQR